MFEKTSVEQLDAIIQPLVLKKRNPTNNYCFYIPCFGFLGLRVWQEETFES